MQPPPRSAAWRREWLTPPAPAGSAPPGASPRCRARACRASKWRWSRGARPPQPHPPGRWSPAARLDAPQVAQPGQHQQQVHPLDAAGFAIRCPGSASRNRCTPQGWGAAGRAEPAGAAVSALTSAGFPPASPANAAGGCGPGWSRTCRCSSRAGCWRWMRPWPIAGATRWPRWVGRCR